MNGLFGVNGLLGYFVAVVLLLAIVFSLAYAAVVTQRVEVNNPYVIENVNALHKISKSNAQHLKMSKGENND